MKGYLISTEATVGQCQAACTNASSNNVTSELPEKLGAEHTLRTAHWKQQEPDTKTGHLCHIPDDSEHAVALSDNCLVPTTSRKHNAVLPELLQPTQPDNSFHLRGDQSQLQEGAIDASLRSWVPPCKSHGPAQPSPFPFCRRNDSAMHNNRPRNGGDGFSQTPPSMDTKIPCAPSPGSLSGVSLAPIDPQAFSRIPGARHRHKQHINSLRSSFDVDFQDLANDPEVLAMIHAQNHCGLHTSPKSQTPALGATGKIILQGLGSNLMHGNVTTTSDHPRQPFSTALPKCRPNRADTNSASSKYKSEGTIFSSRISSAQVTRRPSARCVDSRRMLTQHSIQTDVSDEVKDSLPVKLHNESDHDLPNYIVQINMLQASLERLDLKIAQTGWPPAAIQHNAMRGHHVLRPTLSNQVITSKRKLPGARPKTSAVKASASDERTAYNLRRRPCRQHDTNNTDKQFRNPSVKECKSQSNRNDQACYAHRLPLHCRTPAVNMVKQSQADHDNSCHSAKRVSADAHCTMGMDHAQQIWTQVLLAGVMATFGRCAYIVTEVNVCRGQLRSVAHNRQITSSSAYYLTTVGVVLCVEFRIEIKHGPNKKRARTTTLTGTATQSDHNITGTAPLLAVTSVISMQLLCLQFCGCHDGHISTGHACAFSSWPCSCSGSFNTGLMNGYLHKVWIWILQFEMIVCVKK